MAHRSGERHPRQVPPHLLPPAQPESMLLAPPPPRTTEIRVRPLPQRRPARFRIRWFDLIAITLIVAAVAALCLQR
jgi:hypothetical protein